MSLITLPEEVIAELIYLETRQLEKGVSPIVVKLRITREFLFILHALIVIRIEYFIFKILNPSPHGISKIPWQNRLSILLPENEAANMGIIYRRLNKAKVSPRKIGLILFGEFLCILWNLTLGKILSDLCKKD